jgi:SNF2 family DNA or RNA helicase
MIKSIVIKNDEIEIYSDYNELFIAEIKNILGREWDKLKKCWKIPIYNYYELLNMTSLSQVEKDKIKMIIENEIDYKNVDIQIPILQNGYNLRDYQIDALKFLVKRKSGLLIFDVGTGKTLMSLSYMDNLMNNKKINKTLVLCPKPLLIHWQRQLIQFFDDKYSNAIIYGTKEKRNKIINMDVNVYISTYDVLRNDFELFNNKFSNPQSLIIGDEITAIKNYKSLRAKILKNLKPGYKVGLSAKPLHNNLIEMYSINDWLDNNIFGNFGQFSKRYLVFDDYHNVVRYLNLDDIKTKMKFVMYSKKKEEILKELPPIITKYYNIELSSNEEKDYTNLFLNPINDMINKYNNNEYVEIANILAMNSMARMYIDSYKLVMDSNSDTANNIKNLITANEQSKLNTVMDTIEPIIGNEKILIFTQYKKMTYIIVEELMKRYSGIKVLRMDGSMSGQAQNIVDEFKNNADVLVTTDTAKFGLDMQFCNNLINYDLHYNPEVINQRIGRLHRIGQQNNVLVMNFVVNDEEKIESKVYEIMMKKQNLLNYLMED